MYSFSRFCEEATRAVAVTFGRFQPPTIGHEKLLDAVSKASKTYQIYASHSTDPKKNPLEYDEKIKIMRKMFPRHARAIISDSARTILEIASKLSSDGFTQLIVVVGSDRVPEFQTLLSKYAGVKGAHGVYSFKDGIEVISAGERDPDADGVEGMSASKMREAVTSGNIKTFMSGLPKGYSEGGELFNLLRKRMGLPSLSIREDVQLSRTPIRESFIRGEILPVGSRARVNSTGESVKILSRGANYVLTESIIGKVQRRHWISNLTTI